MSARVDELLAAFDALPERQGGAWDAEAAYRWDPGPEFQVPDGRTA
jgi:hypothetical protein